MLRMANDRIDALEGHAECRIAVNRGEIQLS